MKIIADTFVSLADATTNSTHVCASLSPSSPLKKHSFEIIFKIKLSLQNAETNQPCLVVKKEE